VKYYFHRISAAVLLIAAGVLIWLSNLGILHIAWQRDWPVILIVFGSLALIKHLLRKKART
jgi:predicted membrane protein